MGREQLFTGRQQDIPLDTLIQFLRELFKEHPELPYSDDIRLTKIRIMDVYSLRLQEPELFPAIAIRRLPHRWSRKMIGRLKGLSRKLNEKSQMDFVYGSCVAQCISSEGLEAEQIASIVFHSLVMFKADLAKGGLYMLEVAELGEETPIEMSSEIETVMVPVTLRYIYPVSWKISPESAEPFTDFTIESNLFTIIDPLENGD